MTAMPTRPRRLLAIVAVVAFIVLGNLTWEPEQVEPMAEPTPGPNAECWINYRAGAVWVNWQVVEVSG